LRGGALAGAGRADFLATEALGFLLMLRACRGVPGRLKRTANYTGKVPSGQR
jgi:hypothetical protein